MRQPLHQPWRVFHSSAPVPLIGASLALLFALKMFNAGGTDDAAED